MSRYFVVINYESLEAWEQHGRQIEQITKDGFEAKGATDQTLFISTRSLPPMHNTSFIVPDNVSLEDLNQVQFPEGVRVNITKDD